MLSISYLNHNQLIRSTPNLKSSNASSYIMDYGFPSYALPSHLDCPFYTMCYNSDGVCKEIQNNRSIWRLALFVASYTVIGCLILLTAKFIVSIEKVSIVAENLNPSEIYTETSNYFFVFAENLLANIINIFLFIYNLHYSLSTSKHRI